MRTFKADAFLEALNLPSEHPYAPMEGNSQVDTKEEWSISSYFSSVAWTKDPQTPSSSQKSSGQNDCDFPTPSWRQHEHGDEIPDVCHPDTPPHSTVAAHGYPVSNSSALDFVQEIGPCLISMVHMNVLIWAPIVLAVCLRRLYIHKPYHHQREHGGSAKTVSKEKDSPSQKPSYFIAMPSLTLPALPALRKVTNAHDKQRRQNSEPFQSTPFERLMLLLSLFLNALSVMASISAIFSIEEKKDDPDVLPRTSDENSSRQDIFRKYIHSTSCDALHQGPFVVTSEWVAYVVALIFTAVLMNDAMYVHSFTQSNLVALHLFVISISLKQLGSKVSLATALPISAIALYIMAHQDLDLPTFEAGLYYDETNPFIAKAVEQWPVYKRTYDDGRSTPWMITGDTRTGMPFLVNTVPKQTFVRRWVPLPEEKEAVILDIAFPETIQDDKRVYLILHGINGDSNEGYVVDFVQRQISHGNIVAVMVTRGLGDSTIIGSNILNFARISDVGAAAKALKKAINGVSSDEHMLLVGVGYSMGAITLANYVAQSDSADLGVAIAFSGALDTKQQEYYQRSASLWQPFIAKAMRDTLFSRYSRQLMNKLDQEQIREVMKVKSLVELDRALFAPYNNESLDDYYSKMGAMADFDINGYEGRIANVSIPLLCIQSLDDPIGYWKTFHDPAKVSKSGSGNTLLLFTQTGGHVGWPLGWHASLEGWSWMSDAASSFAESVDLARRNLSPLP